MNIQAQGEVQKEIKALYRRLEELESAVLELTTRVRVLETTRPTLSLKKPEKVESHG
jgi:hypothetical protein